jgi:hypothetical protein
VIIAAEHSLQEIVNFHKNLQTCEGDWFAACSWRFEVGLSRGSMGEHLPENE